MRLGLIGLGRIGVFHAATLDSLPAVESLALLTPVLHLTSAVVDTRPATISVAINKVMT